VYIVVREYDLIIDMELEQVTLGYEGGGEWVDFDFNDPFISASLDTLLKTALALEDPPDYVRIVIYPPKKFLKGVKA
jgi:hypothetical protein